MKLNKVKRTACYVAVLIGEVILDKSKYNNMATLSCSKKLFSHSTTAVRI